MKSSTKEIIKKYLPNLIYAKVSPIYRKFYKSKIEEIGVKNSDWFNNAFKNTLEYQVHYTESYYYFLWTVLLDRIKRTKVKSIIDLGCGPGQFASLLFDNGIERYLGIDFSDEAIKLAKSFCPKFDFKVLDLTKSEILSTYHYDCVVTMEFLEHVEFDLNVLEQIKSGTKVFATVPNFPYVSHVRHFENVGEVINRYNHLFAELSVYPFLENNKGKTFFLIEGIKM